MKTHRSVVGGLDLVLKLTQSIKEMNLFVSEAQKHYITIQTKRTRRERTAVACCFWNNLMHADRLGEKSRRMYKLLRECYVITSEEEMHDITKSLWLLENRIEYMQATIKKYL